MVTLGPFDKGQITLQDRSQIAGVSEQDIRDYVRKWGEARRAAGLGDYADDEPILARNNQYARVEAEALKYLTPEEATGAPR